MVAVSSNADTKFTLMLKTFNLPSCGFQSYLGKRPSAALNAPWAQTWNGTQLDGAPHAHLPGAQMMMSSQQLSFTGSHQGCVNPQGQVGVWWQQQTPQRHPVPCTVEGVMMTDVCESSFRFCNGPHTRPLVSYFL